MEDLAYLLWSLPGLLLAIAVHEFAHAAAADRLGDPTPRRLGRLTLNPIAHIDPVGFLMLLVFRFGWARPVPVDPSYFADRRKGMLLVALAGPASNVVLAFLVLALGRAVAPGGGLEEILEAAFAYNVVLAVFNLLPVPPLDGSRVLAGLLPPYQAARLEQLEAYGFIILVLLLWAGVVDRVMSPLVHGLSTLLFAAVRMLGL